MTWTYVATRELRWPYQQDPAPKWRKHVLVDITRRTSGLGTTTRDSGLIYLTPTRGDIPGATGGFITKWMTSRYGILGLGQRKGLLRHGKPLLVVPGRADLRPAREFLEWHNERVFVS